MCLLIVLDAVFITLATLGYWLGDQIYKTAKQELALSPRNANGTARVLRNDTTGLGVLVFAMWVGSLAVIASI